MSPRARALIRLAILAICGALVVWMVARLGPRRVLAAARDADPLWLALSLVPVPLRFLIWAHKWRRLLARQARVPFGLALRSVLAGAFANHTTPTAKLAGGFVRASMVRRHTGWDRATAYGWALTDQLSNMLGSLTLAGLLALGAGTLMDRGPAATGFLIGGGAALALAAAAVLLRPRIRALSRLPWLARRLPSPDSREGGTGWVERLLAPLAERTSTPAFVADVLWSSAAFAALCLANALTLRALGVSQPLLVVAGCAALGYFAGTLVGTMGGIGATEAALIELYTRVGIAPSAATAGALLHRAGFYLITLVWGGAALVGARSRANDG
jgi:uncharacterized membrane protein YbhN (UPF0104 family)